jgi:uncharacterized protein YcbX
MEVTEIWRYAVKLCAGITLRDAEVDESGSVSDRLCVVATEAATLSVSGPCGS